MEGDRVDQESSDEYYDGSDLEDDARDASAIGKPSRAHAHYTYAKSRIEGGVHMPDVRTYP